MSAVFLKKIRAFEICRFHAAAVERMLNGYKLIKFIFLSTFFVLPQPATVRGADSSSPLLYLQPPPQARYVSRHTGLIVRFRGDRPPSRKELTRLFVVEGENSGPCRGSAALSDDGCTLLFKPREPFQSGERVTVTLVSGRIKEGFYSYGFDISGSGDLRPPRHFGQSPAAAEGCRDHDAVPSYGEVTTLNGVTVPSDFPRIRVSTLGEETAPGYLFFGLRRSYFMILENDGTPYFYRKSNDFLMDFKIQPTGVLSRTVDDWDRGERYYLTMNGHFEPLQMYNAGHGMETDHHDFELLKNGHALLIARDAHRIDMSQKVSGGKRNALVSGCHVQELDLDKNVIFEWRSWDHLRVEDAVHEDLTGGTIDYVHMNSVAQDYDGHIVVSCRNLSECIKIDRDTGEIIWRMGGVNNSLEFLNDADRNSYQHMIRPVPGKPNHYTLFDNGNYHRPAYSRAVEFKVDPIEKTVTRVWQYRASPVFYSGWLGSVMRLANGNTLICWGGGGLPFATEVAPGGEVVYEARSSASLPSYRTYRFEFDGMSAAPELIVEPRGDKLILIFNKFGDPDVDFYNIYTGGTAGSMAVFDTTSATRYDLDTRENDGFYYIKVTAVSRAGVESPPSETKVIHARHFDPGENIISNGDFSDGRTNWFLEASVGAEAKGTIEEGRYWIQIDNAGRERGDILLYQGGLPLYSGQRYRLEFDAYARLARVIEAELMAKDSPFTNYSRIGPTGLRTREIHHAFEFVMQQPTDLHARIVIKCGGDVNDVFIDNLSLKVLPPSRTASESGQGPAGFRLLQSYPNPFNNRTRILYSLPEAGEVEIEIFNVLGQRIHSRRQYKSSAGGHSYLLDAAGMPSGLYFYRIQFEDRSSELKKMMLLR